jgi:dihydroorotate dehydrogenase (fumarate)
VFSALPTLALRARRATAAALIGLSLIAGFVVVSATPAHADEVGISTVPAGSDGKPDGRTRFSYEANPGQQIKDTFLVSNTGTTAQTYTVVGTDAFNDSQGEYALLPTTQQPTGIGTWVHFENGTSRISFALAPGTSRAVVTPGSEVSLDRRVATRLYARVAGQLQPMLSVASISADWGGDWWNPLSGSVTLHYVVKNTGNIALAANTTAAVRTWFGIPVGSSVSSPLSELLPGETAAVDVSLTGIA